jgi:kynurenine formamidase
MRGSDPANLGRRFVDLSHTIESGMVTYRGLPAPVICDHLTREDSRTLYEDGVEFSMERIELLGNTGTWLDTPFHRYAGGVDLSGLALDGIAHLEAVVIRSPFKQGLAVTADQL